MDFIKVCAAAVIGAILILTIDQRQKQIAAVLGLAVCCLVLYAAFTYLSPVVSFFHYLEDLAKIDQDLLNVVLKTVGIGIVTEIASLLCVDSGNASLGKALHILGTSVILWLSIPLFRALLDLLQGLLGEI